MPLYPPAALLRQEESRQYWDQQQAQLTQQINDLEQRVVEKDMVISQLRSDLLHLPLNECDEVCNLGTAIGRVNDACACVPAATCTYRIC